MSLKEEAFGGSLQIPSGSLLLPVILMAQNREQAAGEETEMPRLVEEEMLRRVVWVESGKLGKLGKTEAF